MRAALRGLTTRGRCFLAAGAAVAGAGLLLGERDLVRIGLFLVVLPLVSASVVARTRYQLACTRSMEPARVPAGQSTAVVVRLENVSRLPTGVLLLEDARPRPLGAAPRFVLDRIQPRGEREVSYLLTPTGRGRYQVGPLSVRIQDPFGLCRLTRAFASVDVLVVTPELVPLPAVRLGGDWTGGGDASARSVASSGEDDAATREYRQGDDLRKVHWRSTAHRGEVMVRREEQPWRSRAALLLDTRRVAHRGEGSSSSFEWAVSAVASVGVHLAASGFALRLVQDSAPDLAAGAPSAANGLLLDELAVISPSTGTELAPALGRLRRAAEGLLVAFVGELDGREAEQLARLRRGSLSCVAVLLDTASWSALSPRDRVAAAAAYDSRAALLTRAGWRVLPVSAGVSLATVWPKAGVRSGLWSPTAGGLAGDGEMLRAGGTR
ncbi:MAG: DUF58 domain-containing protein [Actinomycetota bacterium]|nr:DUF58 domain-containing protein [Actinomycetota bacterium]